MSVTRRVAASLGAVALLAPAVAACGDDDFANEPRPPAPVEMAARIDSRGVALSPSRTGAGLATMTISNQSDEPAIVVLSGPTEAVSSAIPAGGVGLLRANLEPGDYEISGGEDSELGTDTLRVGPERPSSSNDLLLP